jgi:hypothetical protein
MGDEMFPTSSGDELWEPGDAPPWQRSEELELAGVG